MSTDRRPGVGERPDVWTIDSGRPAVVAGHERPQVGVSGLLVVPHRRAEGKEARDAEWGNQGVYVGVHLTSEVAESADSVHGPLCVAGRGPSDSRGPSEPSV